MAEPIKLTLAQCQQICADFRLTTKADGKKGCLRSINEEMCSLPSHFLCELVRHKQGIARKEQIKESALSASRVGALERCPRAFHFHYGHKIEPEEQAAWKRMGDAWGVARARLDCGLEVDPSLGLRADLLPYEAAKIKAAIRLYRHKWVHDFVGYAPGEVDCEIEVLFEKYGYWWLGYLDAASKDRQKIWEWKFAVTDYDMLSVARQASVYLLGMPEAKEFTLAVFRKPAQRPGKTESPEAFENRVMGEMTKAPEEWLKKFTFTRDQLDAEGVLRDTAESFRHGSAAGLASGWAPHYSGCNDCDYRSICSQHIGMPTEALVALRKKSV
jgi:hypothetical protein